MLLHDVPADRGHGGGGGGGLLLEGILPRGRAVLELQCLYIYIYIYIYI